MGFLNGRERMPSMYPSIGPVIILKNITSQGNQNYDEEIT